MSKCSLLLSNFGNICLLKQNCVQTAAAVTVYQMSTIKAEMHLQNLHTCHHVGITVKGRCLCWCLWGPPASGRTSVSISSRRDELLVSASLDLREEHDSIHLRLKTTFHFFILFYFFYLNLAHIWSDGEHGVVKASSNFTDFQWEPFKCELWFTP